MPAAIQRNPGTHMLVEINKDGMLIHAHVRNARSPAIERGKRTAAITGIVVHQTDANTAQSSLNSYRNPKANGAHFLIDKDGTIYQTAAIYQRANHVGPLKARCLLVGKCKARDYEGAGVKGMHRIEMMKAPGDRYPSNMEAIGIEMVGRAVLPKGFKPPQRRKELSPEGIRGEFGVYPTPTEAQNRALTWLVEALQDSMQLSPSEVFKHPEVSRKNLSEAEGANWEMAP